MEQLQALKQNLRVWSRRLDIPSLESKAETIMAKVGGGREATIIAVAAEWLVRNGLNKKIALATAYTVAPGVYQACYYPNEKQLYVGIIEEIQRSAKAMRLMQEFHQLAIEAYRRDKNLFTNNILEKARANNGVSSNWDK